ncbi:ribonuclease H2 non-catalytic subunit domain-containing protein [Ceratobasidium sp. AG-Ba]|nr:ribonuclease H2 non-catalytic subunit domain-containing protein [Ceratobasidium sp. AG-Ba]
MTTVPQLLPFHIEHDGPAPVDTYFHVGQDENGNKTAAFRGREMYGVDLALPEGYAGMILRTGEDDKTEIKKKSHVVDVDEEDDASGTRLGPGELFEKIRIWRADAPVDVKLDEYARAMDEWTRMASLVSQRFLTPPALLVLCVSILNGLSSGAFTDSAHYGGLQVHSVDEDECEDQK